MGIEFVFVSTIFLLDIGSVYALSKETELYEHEQYNKQHQFGHIHSKIPNEISGSSKKILFSRLSNINCV
jgi:hypothetical protein